MSFFQELKRRNVFRVAAAYLAFGWLLLKVTESLVPTLHLPGWMNTAVAFFLIIGFPLALFFAWIFEITPDGVKRAAEVEKEKSIARKKRPRPIVNCWNSIRGTPAHIAVWA